MRYICSGKSKKFFDILYGRIGEEGDSIRYCENSLILLRELVLDECSADMIFLEYEENKGFSDLIFNLLDSKNLKIPLILLCDYAKSEKERVNFWLSENEFKYDSPFLHPLIPIFRKISAAMECDDLKYFYSNNDEKDSLLEKIRQTNKLPPVAYNLLSFLYKNNDRDISIREIEKKLHISAESEKIRKNVVYAYLSKLRKCFEEIPRCTMELVRTRKGFYRLFLR